jgi:dipeptidase E
LAEILLLSNSTAPGRSFLEHALEVIAEVLHGRDRLLFVALASGEPDRYTQMMRDGLAPIGIRVDCADAAGGLRDAIAGADAVFVGGGNSFRLLKRLRALGVLDELRARVLAGVPYLGASAGANLACPTIRTTNDMPIVDPGSLRALGLIPFQINAHYPDAEPADPPGTETRQRRIVEFLAANDVPVLGMPEGTWLRLSATLATTGGVTGCSLFRRGASRQELPTGSDVSALLDRPVTFDAGELPFPASAPTGLR